MRYKYSGILALTFGSLVLGVVVPAVAQQPDRALVVLVDVSGSVGKRSPGWYQSALDGISGVVSGERSWRSNWSWTGDTTLLETVGEQVPSLFATVPFGSAPRKAPYFLVSPVSTNSPSERATLLKQSFPNEHAFHDALTFVRLATADVTRQLSDRGLRSATLIVFSDFQQDADVADAEQSALVDAFETQSLPLMATKTVSGYLKASPAIRLRVVALGSLNAQTLPKKEAVPTPSPTTAEVPRVARVSLGKPGSVGNAGPLTFEWANFPGASTYQFELRETSGIGKPVRAVVSANGAKRPSIRLGEVRSGTYQWAVTARNGAGESLAHGELPLKVTGGGLGGGAVFLALVLVAVVAVGFWWWRREQVRRKVRKGT